MRFPLGALLVVIIVLIAAIAYLADRPSTAPRWAGQSDAIWFADYNSAMVNLTETDLASYVHPGDGIAIVFGTHNHLPLYNQEAANLTHQFPKVTIRGYTGLDGARNITGGLALTVGSVSPYFTQLSADYEVNGPLEFDPNGSAAVHYFQEFSSIVHSMGREAIAYPSGRGVLGDYSAPPDSWNYSSFASVTDGQTIETQAYCSNGLPSWIHATQKIWAEYNASGRSISTLSLQISLGNISVNGATDSQAIACAQYWRQVAHGNLFFWWGPSLEGDLIAVLDALGR